MYIYIYRGIWGHVELYEVWGCGIDPCKGPHEILYALGFKVLGKHEKNRNHGNRNRRHQQKHEEHTEAMENSGKLWKPWKPWKPVSTMENHEYHRKDRNQGNHENYGHHRNPGNPFRTMELDTTGNACSSFPRYKVSQHAGFVVPTE